MEKEQARDATWEERSTWGECPVCHAPHGEKCSADVGICLGSTVSGARPSDGVHLARIKKAPMRVALVGVG